MSVILAIDTSTVEASASLLRDDLPVAETSWLAVGNHSHYVDMVIRQLMSIAGIGPKDLSAIAVATGPGSFNGIRVGLSLAKGMTLALEIPLVGISTLDVIGFQAVGTGRPVLATVPAGRGEVCCARYKLVAAELERDTDYLRLDAGQAADLTLPGDVICGPGQSMLTEVARYLPPGVCFYSAVRDLRRASFLAELARRRIDTGGETQTDDVEPLYLRRPAAEEKRVSAAQE